MAVAHLPSQTIALPRPDLHEPVRLHSPRLAAWIPLVVVLAMISSLLYLVLTSELSATGYSIQELQTEEDDWTLRNEQLSLELAQAKSLAAVEAEATTRLLMVRPKDVVYLDLSNKVDPERATTSSRGEGGVPALEKSAHLNADIMEPVQNSISSLLAPRTQAMRRP